MPTLNEKLNSYHDIEGPDIFTSRVGDVVADNLRSDFELRKYQKEAIGRFDFYMDHENLRQKPTQLLYEMATGSGKTLVMAANILQLYKRGYRNFIFFTRLGNIIEKTKENFLNSAGNKYLFNDQIVIDGKHINIQSVDNFEGVNKDDINIIFTTTSSLHRRRHFPKENEITFDELSRSKTALIADEAHNLDALTKSKLTKKEEKEERSWEGTVIEILNLNKENILLEFTATANLSHSSVAEKYEDKLLFRYSLKEFRIDKFSKEIQLLQTDLPAIKRALQAIVVSQYRRKVAEDHGIALKPVVMFKSNYVNTPTTPDPKTKVVSSEFRKKFYEKLNKLTVKDLQEIRNKADGVVEEAFVYFNEQNVALGNLIKELKVEFGEERAISVDSDTKKDKGEKQIVINSLEDEDNEIRVVFAVEALNEGWDVLNLFDIVRLYDSRDAREGVPGQTTVQEAQLIGRGARYYPFQVDKDQERGRRKYDEDINNDLRILEELHYHSASNVRYISELKQALKDVGIIPDNSKEVFLKVKEEIKKTPFWKKGILWVNEKRERLPEDVFSDDEFDFSAEEYSYRIYSGDTQEQTAFEEDQVVREVSSRPMKLSDLGDHVIRAAMDSLEGFDFHSLKKRFPQLVSREEFISSDTFLASVKVSVKGLQERIYGDLSQQDKFDIAKGVLKQVLDNVKKEITEYKGTKKFVPKAIKVVVKDKEMKISLDESGDQQRGVEMRESQSLHQMDLDEKDWYVYDKNYGTSEEKSLVQFISDAEQELRKKYEEIYLLRNQKLFQLYRFSDGKPLEPDFVLFLRDSGKKDVHYQLFIEPKGEHLREGEKWKEEFLKEIEEEYDLKTVYEDKDYRLVGMPFYTEDVNEKFEEKWDDVISS
ncbi:MAG: DEAD/DEAH box helicase family protein [Candidatus Paceibacterota bacterium]